MEESLGSSLSNSTNTTVYPYCYKIKEDCLPCDSKGSEKNACTDELINYMKSVENPYYNKESKLQSEIKMRECLKQFGDIYKRLNIELRRNEKNEPFYPDNERIQSHLNTYLRNVDTNNVSKEILEENMTLYGILLNENLRKIYNKFYHYKGFSYNGEDEESTDGLSETQQGGKKRRTKKRKTNKRKTNKRKTNKRKTRRIRKTNRKR
jgi:hypothetical protein